MVRRAVASHRLTIFTDMFEEHEISYPHNVIGPRIFSGVCEVEFFSGEPVLSEYRFLRELPRLNLVSPLRRRFPCLRKVSLPPPLPRVSVKRRFVAPLLQRLRVAYGGGGTGAVFRRNWPMTLLWKINDIVTR